MAPAVVYVGVSCLACVANFCAIAARSDSGAFVHVDAETTCVVAAAAEVIVLMLTAIVVAAIRTMQHASMIKRYPRCSGRRTRETGFNGSAKVNAVDSLMRPPHNDPNRYDLGFD